MELRDSHRHEQCRSRQRNGGWAGHFALPVPVPRLTHEPEQVTGTILGERDSPLNYVAMSFGVPPGHCRNAGGYLKVISLL